MIHEGPVVLFRFPQTDQAAGKVRPALVLRELPDHYEDWLVCMISSRLAQQAPSFDEMIDVEDADFQTSGLKTISLIRISRLAVVEADVLEGSIGVVSPDRLARIKRKLAEWLTHA